MTRLTQQPIRDAQVRLVGRDFQAVDSVGRFQLTTRGSGIDTLFVRAIGHTLALTPLKLSPDGGIESVALMSSVAGDMTDGCGYVLTRRRKPWWKVW